MSDLLDQLKDDVLDFTVTVTDTDGITDTYEFLDIVNFENIEYAVLSPVSSDGDVEIFRILTVNGSEKYKRIDDEVLLNKVFDIFRIKNEDEFDFE